MYENSFPYAGNLLVPGVVWLNRKAVQSMGLAFITPNPSDEFMRLQWYSRSEDENGLTCHD